MPTTPIKMKKSCLNCLHVQRERCSFFFCTLNDFHVNNRMHCEEYIPHPAEIVT